MPYRALIPRQVLHRFLLESQSEFGFQLNDPLTGLRVIRNDLLNDWQPKSKGFGIETELNTESQIVTLLETAVN